MSGYKSNTAANRDALFGPPKGSSSSGGGSSSRSSAGTPRHKQNNAANREALLGAPTSTSRSKAPAPPSQAPRPPTSTAKGYVARDLTIPAVSVTTATGPAKLKKMKEAEKFRDSAVASMQKGLFTRPDPLTAANFYNRAADIYGQCGETRLERLHRVAAADCQMGSGSYPSAALDYSKAAELALTSSETLERRRKEGNKLWSDASKAWKNAGETSKAATALVQAALAMVLDDETTYMDKAALTAMEEAVEAFVPDVLNPFGKHRATGKSLYSEQTHETPSPETMALARDHAIKAPYAHEQVQQLIVILTRYGEYASALYATGAASYMLENDGVSTLTLSRSYIRETILQLAMGDPVAAEQSFLNRHVQHDHYLQARECKLAEELFRSVLNRDEISLEDARSPSGGNRAAMSALDAPLRQLVQNLRISGAARRTAGITTNNSKHSPLAGFDDDDDDKVQGDRIVASSQTGSKTTPSTTVNDDNDNEEEEEERDPSKMQAEMDDIMAGLDELDGLGSDNEDDDELEDDDDIDLR